MRNPPQNKIILGVWINLMGCWLAGCNIIGKETTRTGKIGCVTIPIYIYVIICIQVYMYLLCCLTSSKSPCTLFSRGCRACLLWSGWCYAFCDCGNEIFSVQSKNDLYVCWESTAKKGETRCLRDIIKYASIHIHIYAFARTSQLPASLRVIKEHGPRLGTFNQGTFYASICEGNVKPFHTRCEHFASCPLHKIIQMYSTQCRNFESGVFMS